MMDDELEFLEDDNEVPDDTDLDTEAVVACPHCGVTVSIGLDPGGGTIQEYIEDCEVCCRPWRVRVIYNSRGSADVELQPME
jgi:hypothetical protein